MSGRLRRAILSLPLGWEGELRDEETRRRDVELGAEVEDRRRDDISSFFSVFPMIFSCCAYNFFGTCQGRRQGKSQRAACGQLMGNGVCISKLAMN